MGMFDDLIPQGSAQKRGGMFDDLIPKKELGPVEELTRGERFASGVNDFLGGAVEAVAPYARGFVQGAADPVVGTAQLAANMVGQGDGINQAIANKEHQSETLGTSGVARFAGNVASPASLAIASRLPAAMSMTKQGLALGAAGGAMTPVVDGGQNFLNEKLTQTALGAGLGGLGGAAIGGLTRSMAPVADDAQRLLQQEGVTLTPGQLAGGSWQRFEDKLTSTPFVGSAISNARNDGIEQFNKAALNRALSPLGESADDVGREGFKQVKSTIGNAYDDVLSRINVRADQQFIDDLTNLRSMAQNMPPERAAQFDKMLDNLALSRFTPAGTMSGATMKNVESELGREASNYMRGVSVDERNIGSALKEVQNTLRQLVMRGNPNEAGNLQKINEAYANYARLRRASSALGAEDGVFSPAQLLNAVKAEDKTVGKAGFAQGKAKMQDLAEAGKKYLGQKVPNSGTADRLLASVANPGNWVSGAIGAAAGIPAAALYSGPVMRGLNKLALRTPSQRTVRMADLIKRGSAPLMLAGTE